MPSSMAELLETNNFRFGPQSGPEDFDKRDLEGKRFLNIAAEIIPQFFQSLDPLQHL